MYREDDPPAPEPAFEPFDSAEPTEYAAPLFDDDDQTSIVHLPWFMIQDEWTRFPELDELEDGDDPTAVERPPARVSQMLADRQLRGRRDTIPSPIAPRPRERRDRVAAATTAPERRERRDTVAARPERRERHDTVSTSSIHEMQTAPAGPRNMKVKEVWEQYDGPDLFDLLANWGSAGVGGGSNHDDPSAEDAAAARGVDVAGSPEAPGRGPAEPPVDHGAEAADVIDALIAREAAAIRPKPEELTFMVDRLDPRKPSKRGLGLLAALLVLAGLGLAILYFHARQIWEPTLSKRAPDTVLPLADDVEQSPAPASSLPGLGVL